jgi:hypothetical protein
MLVILIKRAKAEGQVEGVIPHLFFDGTGGAEPLLILY